MTEERDVTRGELLPADGRASRRGQPPVWLRPILAAVVGLTVGSVAGHFLWPHRPAESARGSGGITQAVLGEPVVTATLSPVENALPSDGLSDRGTDPATVPMALRIDVPPGRYLVTLESDMSVCFDHQDAILDQAFLLVPRPLDPVGWYHVVSEGQFAEVKVPSGAPGLAAFIIESSTADNRGSAEIRFYPHPSARTAKTPITGTP